MEIFKFIAIALFVTLLSSEIVSQSECGNSEMKCTCSTNVLHCEVGLHVDFFSIPSITEDSEEEDFWRLKFICNQDITPRHLSLLDYHSLLGLRYTPEIQVYYSWCPEPEDTFRSLLRPHSSALSNGLKDVIVKSLEIYCDQRREFQLNSGLLFGLIGMEILVMRCSPVLTLPEDLFNGTVPDLVSIEISETQIHRIPERFFSNLYRLVELDLNGNRIRSIGKDELFGLWSLTSLDVSQNELEFIAGDAFQSTPNLEQLDLHENRLLAMPESLSSLNRLSKLNIRHNFIQSFGGRMCDGLKSLSEALLDHNNITRFDSSCFSSLQRANWIDISWNFIKEIPAVQLSLQKLHTFDISHNTAGPRGITIPDFLRGDSLINVHLINSSITSIHKEFLHHFPKLLRVDLSTNMIQEIHPEFFQRNVALKLIGLDNNRINILPPKSFESNFNLQYLNISSNNMSRIPFPLFAPNGKLNHFDATNNSLETLPENLFAGLSELSEIRLSCNRISFLGDLTFRDNKKIATLDLSQNLLTKLSDSIFSPLQRLEQLNLEDNLLVTLPLLKLKKLKRLDLSRNRLSVIPDSAFYDLPILETLNLSRNLIPELSNTSFLRHGQKLYSLDLSHNKLRSVTREIFTNGESLIHLDLSWNDIKTFYLDCASPATNLYELNLSHNDMDYVGILAEDGVHYDTSTIGDADVSLKVLNLSGNRLTLDYIEWEFDDVRKTWGKISPFHVCSSLEELNLSDNLFDTIFMDWRNTLTNLKLLDLRGNKIRYLTHQDMLFSSVTIDDKRNATPYSCSHYMTVDLRGNEIEGVELPQSLLKNITRDMDLSDVYGHVSIELEDNPFSCGCELLNFLRLINDNVALTSELERTDGVTWIRPAKIKPGRLSCWKPSSVRGKEVSNPETWIHHLLPMFGLCSLDGLY